MIRESINDKELNGTIDLLSTFSDSPAYFDFQISIIIQESIRQTIFIALYALFEKSLKILLFQANSDYTPHGNIIKNCLLNIKNEIINLKGNRNCSAHDINFALDKKYDSTFFRQLTKKMQSLLFSIYHEGSNYG